MAGAVREATRIRGTFPRPPSPPTLPHDLIVRLEKLESQAIPSSPPLDIAVADLVRRVDRLEVGERMQEVRMDYRPTPEAQEWVGGRVHQLGLVGT